MTMCFGTAAMTMQRSTTLLRAGVAANLVAGICYLIATVLVYELLRSVDATISALAAVFSIAGSTVSALSMAFQLAGGFKALTRQTSDIAFVFFGLHVLLVGTLILRSTLIHRGVGLLMSFGGIGWLTFAATNLLFPDVAPKIAPYLMLPGIFGEFSLTLWLLIAGVDGTRWTAMDAPARQA